MHYADIDYSDFHLDEHTPPRASEAVWRLDLLVCSFKIEYASEFCHLQVEARRSTTPRELVRKLDNHVYVKGMPNVSRRRLSRREATSVQLHVHLEVLESGSNTIGAASRINSNTINCLTSTFRYPLIHFLGSQAILGSSQQNV